MSKVYIIVSLMGSTGQVAGLFGPNNTKDETGWGVDASAMRYRDAAPELREQVRNAVDEKFPEESSRLMGEMGDSAILFTRRKAARTVLANLNAEGSWDWRILECGPPVARDMRPVLGWRIIFSGEVISAFNASGAAEYPDDTILLGDEEYAFKTRKVARGFFKRHIAGGLSGDYTIEPVYGAYRVDWGYSTATDYYKGSTRFRTKAAAEKFARGYYADGYHKYRVVLHDAPVPEDQLYVPL